MKYLKLITTMTILGIATGCAPVKFSEVITDRAKYSGGGYLVGLPEVLVVHEANIENGVCKKTLKTISVPSNLYQAVSFPAAIGNSAVDVTIQDGWLLTKANVTTNTTDIVKEIIGKAFPAGAAVASANTTLANNDDIKCETKVYKVEGTNPRTFVEATEFDAPDSDSDSKSEP